MRSPFGRRRGMAVGSVQILHDASNTPVAEETFSPQTITGGNNQVPQPSGKGQ
jgi:hypothetical protein